MFSKILETHLENTNSTNKSAKIIKYLPLYDTYIEPEMMSLYKEKPSETYVDTKSASKIQNI